MPRSFDAEVNAAFTSSVLTEVHAEVKKLFPTYNLRKDAWVYGFGGRGGWEFQTVPRSGGPRSFYWSGDAYNAADARAKGWCAYMRQHASEAYVPRPCVECPKTANPRLGDGERCTRHHNAKAALAESV